ncbi:hypothetical protein WQ54_20565 [Bacillus sp. SA1-12]|nr:hypothetical protein WQ54_20565 [Bacillus sp. SA1-12]
MASSNIFFQSFNIVASPHSDENLIWKNVCNGSYTNWLKVYSVIIILMTIFLLVYHYFVNDNKVILSQINNHEKNTNKWVRK